MESSVVSCGALIYARSTKRYLFLLRDQTKHSGSWGLAGGKVEKHEKVVDALFRELREELGRDFQGNKLIPVEKFTSENSTFEYHTFLLAVNWEFVPILNAEHRGYCWVKITDHPKPLHPGVWRTFSFSVIKDKLLTLESALDVGFEDKFSKGNLS